MHFMKGDIRYYKYNDNLYPSVTSILTTKFMVTPLAKWQIRYTAEYVVDNIKTIQNIINQDREYAKDIIEYSSKQFAQKRANCGTAVHEWICAKDKDKVKQPAYITGYCDQYKQWIKDFNVKTLESEIVCINDHPIQYAGTIDAICEINGELWIIDFKTSKYIYNSTFLQLIAYGNSCLLAKGNKYEQIPTIDNYGIVQLHKDKYKFLQLDAAKFIDYWDIFCSYYQLFIFYQDKRLSFANLDKPVTDDVNIIN